MRVIRTALTTIYFGFAVLIGFEYFRAYPIPEIAVKILEIFFIPLFILLCISAGNLFFSVCDFAFSSALEKYVFAFALGTGILSITMFLLGILGLYYPALVWVLVLVLFVVRRNDLIEITASAGKSLKTVLSAPAKYILIFLPAGLSLFLIALASLAPPTYYDSLSYHYAIPGMYVASGKITNLSFNFYSHFPQNYEMLYAFAMLLGGYITPNFVTFTAGLFSLLAVYSFSKRFLDVSAARIAVLLLSTATAFMLLSTGGYVEAGLALYAFMAVYSFIIHRETGHNLPLILSGIFCGLAFGTKYTGGIIFLLLFVMVVASYFRKRRPGYLLLLGGFSVSMLLVSLPWLVKNIANTGNPFFPFFHEHIGSQIFAWKHELAINYFNMLGEYRSAKGFYEIIREIILFPFSLIHSPQKYGGGFDMLGDFGWMFLIISVPSIIFVRQKRNDAVKILLFFAALFFVSWFLTKPVLRFLYPVLPIAAIISAYSLVSLWRENNFLKYPLSIGMFLFVILNFYLYFSIQKLIEPFGVAIGTETRPEYLSRKLLNSPYPAFEFINLNLPGNSRILFVGERRGYYCKRNYVTIEVFSAGQNPLIVWANSSKDTADFKSKLLHAGITHVLYNKNEGVRLRGYGILSFSKNGTEIWEMFLLKTPKIFESNSVFIYSLLIN